jgi:tRNA nucleotidyltransferase (CCA-adding enzyme)
VARSEPIPAALRRAVIPRAVLGVLRRLDAAGHRSWLVGGAVRDLLLHRRRRAADFDVATPARPEEVMNLFPRVVPTGIEHGTLTVLEGDDKIEVTTFRGEGAYVDGRRPSSVTFHSSLEDDLARRDFTMNALAYDPVGREFRDPFRGQADIRRRLVRAVGDPAARFREDGLRPLRAVRFAAQLGYALERRTRAAIPGALEVVRLVSTERVADEVSKLVTVPDARKGLELLERTGLLGVVFPQLASLPRRRVTHAIAVAGAVDADATLRFAALLHVLLPADAMQSIVALRLPNRVAAEVGALVRERGCLLGRPAERQPESDVEVRRWLSRVGAARAPALLDLWDADARGLGIERIARELTALRRLRRRAERELRRRPPLTAADLALDGRAVMGLLQIPPGREVGEALRHLLERVIDDPSRNTRRVLRAELEAWAARRPR